MSFRSRDHFTEAIRAHERAVNLDRTQPTGIPVSFARAGGGALDRNTKVRCFPEILTLPTAVHTLADTQASPFRFSIKYP